MRRIHYLGALLVILAGLAVIQAQENISQPSPINITAISGTAPTTAGKFDVKGADGDVFVRQSTPANLRTQDASSGTVGSAAPSVASFAGDKASGNLIAHVGCDKSVAISTSSSGDVQLVALSGSTVVYVCGYNVMANGTTNVQFEYGTGSACGTGKTALTGAYPLTAQTGVSYGNGEGVVLQGAAGNALCVNNSAAIAIAGVVTYTQF